MRMNLVSAVDLCYVTVSVVKVFDLFVSRGKIVCCGYGWCWLFEL